MLCEWCLVVVVSITNFVCEWYLAIVVTMHIILIIKKKGLVRMENSGDIDNLANGINDVSLVPTFQTILISHPGLDS